MPTWFCFAFIFFFFFYSYCFSFLLPEQLAAVLPVLLAHYDVICIYWRFSEKKEERARKKPQKTVPTTIATHLYLYTISILKLPDRISFVVHYDSSRFSLPFFNMYINVKQYDVCQTMIIIIIYIIIWMYLRIYVKIDANGCDRQFQRVDFLCKCSVCFHLRPTMKFD